MNILAMSAWCGIAALGAANPDLASEAQHEQGYRLHAASVLSAVNKAAHAAEIQTLPPCKSFCP